VGAHLVLDPGADVSRAVHDLTHGIGADLVIEASGAPSALAESLSCAAFQGTILVCSWYGTKPVALPLGGAFHRKRLRLVSSQVGSIDPSLEPRWNRERRLHFALSLLDQLVLRPLITQRIPIERAAEAYDLLDRRPGEAAQVILTFGS
jgi:threonine dehydrogenase-like Zn-dependent dehydrogenase